jgi:hypothetical protein
VNSRLVTKRHMMDDRLKAFKKLVCDCCEKKDNALEMHEIVGRYRTQTDLAVRNETYRKEICVLLCDKCHMTLPITAREYTDKLFAKLYRLYGKDRVKDTLYEIPKQYRVGIILPE